jgi:predicted SnoaL-like aldol condensation-catalyzing enzyme
MADNLALVHRMFDEVINAGKLDVIGELFAEDFIDHGPTGDSKGRDAFRAMVAAWRAAAPDVHCEVLHGFESGDMVGWVVHTTGTHTGDDLGIPGSGKPFDTYSANIGRLENGKAVEHWAEQGMLASLIQWGVIQLPGS